MKFSTVFISLGFAALAAAQANSTRAVASPTQTSSYSTAVASCLGKCKEADVTCRAQCLGSAAPNDGAANATNECVAKCPKGDGSQAQTDQYAACANSCINTIFLSTSSVAPAATGSSGSGSGSGSGGNSGNPTSSGSKPSGTGSSTSSSSSGAPNAGSSVEAGGSFLLLLGMAAGILAL
ncbi:hypothetical protein B9Z19DRAFT_1065335 [Tuber borchii]|uniref:Extracellular membrane protein CFEM domain-containing protein n=1 Tax=Tuber borchii TaxID=42251 RepID=A0A2T6ZRL3_TUBBO|nr:hypothetical protein B9Z19DRAFT_1065335 [Tuber borchii]